MNHDLLESLLRQRKVIQGYSTRHLKGDMDLNPDISPVTGKNTSRPAAVLVPFIDREDDFTLLLTVRSKELKSHAGQISFPGGRLEPSDKTPVEAALREACEEVGIKPEQVSVLGTMPDYQTITNFRVTPVLGVVDPAFVPEIDKNEVDRIFEVPLRHALNPENYKKHARVFAGKERFYYALFWEDYYIWGATAAILVNVSQSLYDWAEGSRKDGKKT